LPQVPYVGMRSFCAIMGSITVPIVYAIMRESGYPVGIALFSAFLILFGEFSLLFRPYESSQLPRQRPHHPNPTHPPRRSTRPLHVPLRSLLRQVSSATISGVYENLVVMAPCDWCFSCLHAGMQNGRAVHLLECRSGCALGSVGNTRYKAGTSYCELQGVPCTYGSPTSTDTSSIELSA